MYKRIGLRALLLMAQNFCAQGDHYQAGYILNNLIENAPDPDIREEARVLKQFIDSDSASANAGRGQTAVTDENSSNDTKNDTK